MSYTDLFLLDIVNSAPAPEYIDDGRFHWSLVHQLMLQNQRAIVEAMFERTVPAIKATIEAVNELLPTVTKPPTPRDRLRALKAHPRSARGRR